MSNLLTSLHNNYLLFCDLIQNKEHPKRNVIILSTINELLNNLSCVLQNKKMNYTKLDRSKGANWYKKYEEEFILTADYHLISAYLLIFRIIYLLNTDIQIVLKLSDNIAVAQLTDNYDIHMLVIKYICLLDNAGIQGDYLTDLTSIATILIYINAISNINNIDLQKAFATYIKYTEYTDGK